MDPYWFVAAHELGHMLAWPHSYTGTTGSQYDNPLDLMSRPPMPNYQPRAPQLTLAFNRFAAGWLDAAKVAVHRGLSGSYTIGAMGSGAPELLVVPGTEPGAFVTLEVRQATGWDSSLAITGVAIHRVDQRSGMCTTAASQNLGGFGLQRCTNLERRQQQFGPQGVIANSYANVVGAGSVVDLGGAVVTISDAGGGRFRVDVSGAAVTVPALTGPQPAFSTVGGAHRAARRLGARGVGNGRGGGGPGGIERDGRAHAGRRVLPHRSGRRRAAARSAAHRLTTGLAQSRPASMMRRRNASGALVLRARRRSARAAPPRRTTPSERKHTLLATSRAKPISWVASIIVMPSSASSRTMLSTSDTSSGSRAEVISSSSSTRGPMASARTMATRCC